MNFNFLKNTGNNVNLLILFFILCCLAVFISPAFLDFDNIQNNSFQVTKEYKIKSSSTGLNRRPDIVLFVNGIPLVDIETKSPVRESKSWA